MQHDFSTRSVCLFGDLRGVGKVRQYGKRQGQAQADQLPGDLKVLAQIVYDDRGPPELTDFAQPPPSDQPAVVREPQLANTIPTFSLFRPDQEFEALLLGFALDRFRDRL